ncbi:hypothetical protein N0V90_006920 [Kalmusia sp. IMI 367209]|nr:hypothetical protein N0V90_006920 [Kalmusia sp. IMI 367209]
MSSGTRLPQAREVHEGDERINAEHTFWEIKWKIPGTHGTGIATGFTSNISMAQKLLDAHDPRNRKYFTVEGSKLDKEAIRRKAKARHDTLGDWVEGEEYGEFVSYKFRPTPRYDKPGTTKNATPVTTLPIQNSTSPSAMDVQIRGLQVDIEEDLAH